MSVSQRNGVHPFDDELADKGLLAWILPSLQVLTHNLPRIAPAALAYGAYVWVLPRLLLADDGGGVGARIFDSVQMSAVLAACMGVGYAVLVRGEGKPYGLAQVAPIVGIVERLGLVTLFWLIFWAAFGWLAKGFFGALADSPPLIEFSMWLLSNFGWWSIPIIFWVFSPIIYWLATVSALSQIRAIRGEEPVNEIVVDSFRRVFAQPLRIAIPGYILGAAAILVLYVFSELIFKGFARFVMETGWGAMVVLAVFGVLLVLPFWFVIERVYAPELGLEDDVQIGLEDVGESLPAMAVDQPLSDQLSAVQAEQGSEAAVRHLANWVRAHQARTPELAVLIQQLGQPESLSRELAAVATEWNHSSKPVELAWLVEQGLGLNPAFMMDAPDPVLSLSKKLTALDRPDLASRLLLTLLKQHRAHPDHLASGLQLARVLATHSNNVDGARKLLGQLGKMYPGEPQIAQMVKFLG